MFKRCYDNFFEPKLLHQRHFQLFWNGILTTTYAEEIMDIPYKNVIDSFMYCCTCYDFDQPKHWLCYSNCVEEMLSNPLQHITYNSLNETFVICNAQLIMISSMLITDGQYNFDKLLWLDNYARDQDDYKICTWYIFTIAKSAIVCST
jgi:hypothetical protein